MTSINEIIKSYRELKAKMENSLIPNGVSILDGRKMYSRGPDWWECREQIDRLSIDHFEELVEYISEPEGATNDCK